jgi:hypothetical protein
MLSRRELYAAGLTLGECCTRARAGGGYVCGGGGGSSKSSSTTNTTTTVQDKRLVVDGGAIGITADNSSVNVQSLDAGIANKAIDANAEGLTALLNSGSEGFERLLTVAEKLITNSSDVVSKSQDAALAQIEAINARAADQEGSIDNKTLTVLAIAGAAALVLSRGK